MTDGGKNKRKGFSGLDSMVSNTDDIDLAKPSSEKNTTTKVEPESEVNARTSPPAAKTQSASSPSKATAPVAPKSPSGSGFAWFIGLGFIVILLVIGSQSEQSGSTYSSSSSGSTVSPSATRPSSVSSGTASALPEMTKPPAGTEHLHSVTEIRWCLAEDIRIETVRNTLTTNEAISRFNSRVDDYNRRCGSYRYYENTLSRARRDIDAVRSVIAQGALSGLQTSQRTQPDPTVRDIQEGLSTLGYSPGPSDGYFGAKTRLAIEAFQRDIGVPISGEVSEQLISQIERARLDGVLEELSAAAAQTEQRQSQASSSEQKTAAVDANNQIPAQFGIFQIDASGNYSFVQSDVVPNTPGQGFGWYIWVGESDKAVSWTEKLVLPKAAANWSGMDESTSISPDRRVATTRRSTIPDEGWIYNVWEVAEGDPVGRYLIEVASADGSTLQRFNFSVEATRPR